MEIREVVGEWEAVLEFEYKEYLRSGETNLGKHVQRKRKR